jgi:hypothetical protein
MTSAIAEREARLRRSLRRLGCDVVGAERGHFHIRREGSKDTEAPDLFAPDLAGAEQWIGRRGSNDPRRFAARRSLNRDRREHSPPRYGFMGRQSMPLPWSRAQTARVFRALANGPKLTR